MLFEDDELKNPEEVEESENDENEDEEVAEDNDSEAVTEEVAAPLLFRKASTS